MIIYTLFYFAVIFTIASPQETTIQWRYGEIHGLVDTVYVGGNNFTVNKFLGIPFAKPPVGELRFKKPVPVDSVNSPYYAKEYGNECVQFNFNLNFSQLRVSNRTQSEDCLYLNVYVPEKAADSTSGHAVAVWIHGGGFLSGSGSDFDGSFFSFYGNVIVVTINYRLGPYGFLSTEDENAPGNYAFWDQHVAVRWVHENIEYFGGDKNRVTIFGESAGAISVCHQGLIPQNKGLFQRTIAQSGSAVDPTSPKLDSNAIEDARTLGSVLGCSITTHRALMECLRSKSNEEIIDSMIENKIPTTSYEYVIDNDLIKREIATIPSLLDNHKLEEVEFYRSLDVINGFNSHEGFLIVEVFLANLAPDFLITRDQMKAMLQPILGMLLGIHLDESVVELIMHEYTNWSNPVSKEDVRLQLIKLFGDLFFGEPAVVTAKMHALSGTLSSTSGNYMYHFVANPRSGILQTPEWIHGANHADDIPFITGVDIDIPDNDSNITWEAQLSRKMIRYWSNFMKSGDPNLPEHVMPPWPKYDITSQSYIKLEENMNDNSVGKFLLAKETNIWNNLIPRISEAIDEKSRDNTDCRHVSSAGTSSAVVPSFLSLTAVYLFVYFFN
ncbi:Neuroligin-2 [Mactra antiquata]